MTAEAQTGVPADLMEAPSLALDDAQLGDLELLLSGVFAPLTGFMTAADVDRGRRAGHPGGRHALADPGDP